MEGPKTPRGEQYRERYPDQVETKLFIARDKNGAPNETLFREGRLLDSRMAKYPWYVGVVPNGSGMKGYSEPRTRYGGSDIDMVVLMDDTKAGNVSARETLDRECGQPTGERGGYYDFHIADVSEPEIREFITDPTVPNRIFGVWNLFGPATGERIDQYRALFRNIFLSHSPAERVHIVDKLVESIRHAEETRLDVMQQRTKKSGTMESPITQETLLQRSDMWRARINKILASE